MCVESPTYSKAQTIKFEMSDTLKSDHFDHSKDGLNTVKMEDDDDDSGPKPEYS